MAFPGESLYYPPTTDHIKEPWGNYIILKTDATSSEYSYVFSCVDWCRNPNKPESCSNSPVFWLLNRVPDSNAFGVPVEDRIAEALTIYKQAGASDTAVEYMKNAFYTKNMEFCEKYA